MAQKKTKEALELIAKQLVKTWEQPDMPPWSWDMIRQEVKKVAYIRTEAEIHNRVEALSLPDIGRFLQVCNEMEAAGVMPKAPEPEAPKQEAPAKIEAVPFEPKSKSDAKRIEVMKGGKAKK